MFRFPTWPYYPLDALPPNWSTASRAHTIVPKVSACRGLSLFIDRHPIMPYCAGSSPDAGTPTYKLVPKKMPVRTSTAEGPMKDRHLPFPGPAPSRRVTGVELDESSGELGSGRMMVTSSPSRTSGKCEMSRTITCS